MGGDGTGRTGPDCSPLSPAVDVARRGRKRSLFTGLVSSTKSGGDTAVLHRGLGMDETASLADPLAIRSERSATLVRGVREKGSENVPPFTRAFR